MELKAGYKLTEVGVIPEDWDVKHLAEITTEIGDGIHTTPEYIPSSEFYFINGNNLVDGKIVISENTMCVSEIEYRRLRKKLNNRTILISINGTIGNLATYDGEAVVLGKSAAYINIIQDIYKEYIYYSLMSASTANYIKNELTGTTINNFSLESLRNSPIPLPRTQDEQKSIAATLSDVDALITALDRLIAKKRDIKQAAMQELLTGKRRLPGFVDEWKVKKLEDFGFIYSGLISKIKADFGTGNAYYIPFLNVLNNAIIDPNNLELVKVGENESQNQVHKGDLFFNGSSETPEEVGLCSALLDEINIVYLNSFCFGFRFYREASVDGLYIAYFFRSVEGRKLLYSLAQGATRYNLSKRRLLVVKFKIPTIEEQIAIASIISDMDAEIATLEKRREKTLALKQGMMQELLTGRIRLVQGAGA